MVVTMRKRLEAYTYYTQISANQSYVGEERAGSRWRSAHWVVDGALYHITEERSRGGWKVVLEDADSAYRERSERCRLRWQQAQTLLSAIVSAIEEAEIVSLGVHG